ncbi:MAG TPA: ATP-binding cassette domain-containing protein, partial [Burkholderiaceae bacterium]|nr:ATP-binding cassette domain-containing protein [Burkholderiaceae bacterium]
MLLSIRDLKVAFRLGERGAVTLVPAVSGVGFDIPEHTTVALVGESGSGKSVTAMSILSLLPDNAQRSGVIEFDGRDLLKAPLAEPLVKHLGMSGRQAIERAEALLAEVGIPEHTTVALVGESGSGKSV